MPSFKIKSDPSVVVFITHVKFLQNPNFENGGNPVA
jgi:hypothetical protein